MKKISSLFIFLLLFSIFAAAQELQNPLMKKEWITVQSDDKKLSVDFPSDMIIDAETGGAGRKCRLVGFNNGLIMELIQYDESSYVNFLRRSNANLAAGGFAFEKEGFKGYKISSTERTGLQIDNLYFSNGEGFYIIKIRSPKGKTAESERFFYSIKLAGKSVFANTKEQPQTSKSVTLSSLKSSQVVFDALKRNSEKQKKKVIHETITPEKIGIDYEGLTAPPVIVKGLYFLDKTEKNNFSYPKLTQFNAQIKVTLLANGQIGDIWIYCNAEQKYIDELVAATERVKFVPAQKNGVNVDSYELIEVTVSRRELYY